MANLDMRRIQEEHLRAIQERTEKYQREYDPDGYHICRGELYGYQRDPAFTIRYSNASFNAAAIKGLPDVEYIRFEIDEVRKYLVAIASNQDDKNAVRWCTVKEGKRWPRIFSRSSFCELISALTGWDRSYNYKLIGYKIRAKGSPAYLFDLNAPERSKPEKRKRKKVEGDYLKSERPFAAEQEEAVNGMTFEEAQRRAELQRQMDGE